MKHKKRNDIRYALNEAGLTMADIARHVGVSGSRPAQAIDDPSPANGRKIKVLVARRLCMRVDDLWPGVKS